MATPYGPQQGRTRSPYDLTPTVSYDEAVRRATPDSDGYGVYGGGYTPSTPTAPVTPTPPATGLPASTGGTLPQTTPGTLGVGTGFQYQNPGFDDPATRQFFDLMSQLVGKLTGKVSDPAGDQAQSAIQQLMARLFGGGASVTPPPVAGGMPPGFTGFTPDGGIDEGGIGNVIGPGEGDYSADPSLYPARTSPTDFLLGGAGGTSPAGGDLGAYQSQLDALVKQLQGPVFNDANLASLKTNAVDTLNHQKATEIQTTLRQLAARGVSPSSGIAQAAIQDVHRRYDTLMAQQTQGLNSFEMGQQATRPGQIADLSAKRFGAGQDATNTGLTLAKTLSDMSSAKRAEEIGNWSKALGLTGSGVDLTERRIAGAGSAGAGGTGDIASIISSILGLSNTTNGQNQNSALNNQAWLQQLGQLLASYNKKKES